MHYADIQASLNPIAVDTRRKVGDTNDVSSLLKKKKKLEIAFRGKKMQNPYTALKDVELHVELWSSTCAKLWI